MLKGQPGTSEVSIGQNGVQAFERFVIFISVNNITYSYYLLIYLVYIDGEDCGMNFDP